jgi:ABC-type uncharacterized transport system permease subunit
VSSSWPFQATFASGRMFESTLQLSLELQVASSYLAHFIAFVESSSCVTVNPTSKIESSDAVYFSSKQLENLL